MWRCQMGRKSSLLRLNNIELRFLIVQPHEKCFLVEANLNTRSRTLVKKQESGAVKKDVGWLHDIDVIGNAQSVMPNLDISTRASPRSLRRHCPAGVPVVFRVCADITAGGCCVIARGAMRYIAERNKHGILVIRCRMAFGRGRCAKKQNRANNQSLHGLPSLCLTARFENGTLVRWDLGHARTPKCDQGPVWSV